MRLHACLYDLVSNEFRLLNPFVSMCTATPVSHRGVRSERKLQRGPPELGEPVVEENAFQQYGRGSPKRTSTSSGKGGKGYGPNFCSNCLFSVRHQDLAGFQMTNGVIVKSDIIALEPDDIQICDDCKCSGTNSIAAIASVEAECDPYLGIDVLELTLTSTTEVGSASVVCPDVSYFASAACETFFIAPNGGARTSTNPPDARIQSLLLEGPTAFIEIDEQTYADCTVVCTNPNPPPLPPAKGKSGKATSLKGTTNTTKISKKSSILRNYDPFGDKFPF